jgi:hypothetical protein
LVFFDIPAALSDGDNPARFMQASTVDDMMKAIG